MSRTVSTPEAIAFRSKLGFKQHDIILSKEQSVISKTKLFSIEKILPQHGILGYKIDLYFPEHKLARKVDEKGHTDGDKWKEIKRQEAIEKKISCKFIRINPNEKDYDEYAKFGEVNNDIIESTKKPTKKSLRHKISKRLLELEFKSNHSIKSKCLKRIVKYMLPTLYKHANLLFRL